MDIRIAALRDRVQSSLFIEPMGFVVGAVALAALTLWADGRIGSGPEKLPLGLSSTVESARTLVSTVAGATITVAGIAFSVTLLVYQLASSQYSPRVVQGLFRDPFNKRVMGFVVGVFTYCLVVLRSVRTTVGDRGEATVPNISVALAVVFGIASVLAIVAFINHNAHTMDVSEILATVSAHTLATLRRTWAERDSEPSEVEPLQTEAHDAFPRHDGFVVDADSSGWIGYIDHEAILEALCDRSQAHLVVEVGEYIVEGLPLCTVSPQPHDPSTATAEIRTAISIGRTRSIVQDPSYGIRQLADVALKALSPGVNDPTTACDAIRHEASVLAEAYRRDPPPDRISGDRDTVVTGAGRMNHDRLVELAFAEVRRDAASHPTVAITLIDTIADLLALPTVRRCPARGAALHRQAILVLAACERSDHLPDDLAEIRAAFHRRVQTPAASPITQTVDADR